MVESNTVPYVYIGQANLYNKVEAGAELAAFVNKVMNNYVHKEGVFTGLIDNGRIGSDDNYRNRLEEIGIRLDDEGKVISQPDVDDRQNFKASVRKGNTSRMKRVGGIPSGSTISSNTPAELIHGMLGQAHLLRPTLALCR